MDDKLAWKMHKQVLEGKQMELKVEGFEKVEDGKHSGVITELQERKVEYNGKDLVYIDLIIEFEQGKRLKKGVSAKITDKSKLGKLLKVFGVELKVGSNINIKDVFVGKSVSFMTVTETTDRGEFAKIVEGSIKPVE